MKPVIGITTYARNDRGDFTLPSAYVDAVRRAGGVPVLLTPGEADLGRLLELVHGVVFAGGGDVTPQLSGSGEHPTINRVNEERDRFEIGLYKKLLGSSHPVLGVCRGMQILNVAAGGTLIAHLPDVVGIGLAHDGENHTPVLHAVRVEGDAAIAEMLGTRAPTVVSHHHQGLGRVGEGWRVVARAGDGVIEAMEHTGRPWMRAVLWHPEMSPPDDIQHRLFAGLVAAAAE